MVSVGQRCGVAVPFASLSAGPDGTSVYVASDDRVEARPVTTGLSSGQRHRNSRRDRRETSSS
jgi:hypothetical protein